MFLLAIVGVATWRRRRNAHTRDRRTATNGAERDNAEDDVGVAVIHNANYRPEEAVVLNMPIRQPRRSIRATSCPVRFPEGVAGS
jgi:hypothetical protein